MDFNRAEPTCYRTNFPYTSSKTKWSFLVHRTRGNAPYVLLRLDSILELCLASPIVMGLDNAKLIGIQKANRQNKL